MIRLKIKGNKGNPVTTQCGLPRQAVCLLIGFVFVLFCFALVNVVSPVTILEHILQRVARRTPLTAHWLTGAQSPLGIISFRCISLPYLHLGTKIVISIIFLHIHVLSEWKKGAESNMVLVIHITIQSSIVQVLTCTWVIWRCAVPLFLAFCLIADWSPIARLISW